MSILLMLQQYVDILKLFLAVIAEWLEYINASLFTTHYFLIYINLIL